MIAAWIIIRANDNSDWESITLSLMIYVYAIGVDQYDFFSVDTDY